MPVKEDIVEIQPKSVWETYNGQIMEWRKQGLALQLIGDKVGVTRERVRQVLERYYGTTVVPGLVPRGKLARLLGCSSQRLQKLEKEGLLTPDHYGGFYLYDRDESEKAALMVIQPPKPDVERICEVCDRKFYVRPYTIRPTSPRRFCSRRCQGVWWGRHYGFGVHRKFGGGYRRKWDYDQVYKLRLETGCSARSISMELGIPEVTVYSILHKLFGKPLPKLAHRKSR